MKTLTELRTAYSERAAIANLLVQVHADGLFNAQVAVVGEAPGVREIELKSPFVGGAGALLWTELRKLNIHRHQVYITNVVKRQVSLSNYNDNRAPVGKAEQEQWEALLRWELSQLPNLRYVLVLGAEALSATVALKGVSHWRGSALDWEGKKVFITFNPAAVLREPKSHVIFIHDIKKFGRLLNGHFSVPTITSHSNLRPQEVSALCDRLTDEALPISFDIETMHGETACIGLTNTTNEGWCINFRTATDHIYSLQDELAVRLRLQKLFMDKRLQFVAQNGNFDVYWMWYKDRLRVSRVWFDTLLAHHTLYPLLPHSLGFLVSTYTDHPYYKDEGKTWKEAGGNIETFWEYNVKDVCLTLACQKKLYQELKTQKLDDYFFNHVMRLQPWLAQMTVDGVLCDVVERDRLAEASAVEVAQALGRFRLALERAGVDDWEPNLRSNKDMRELYFRRLKLVGRGQSTDDENRAKMLAHPRTSQEAKEVILAHNAYAEAHKFDSTYAHVPLDPDNRFRCEYKQYGTTRAPGRLSSARTLWGSGTNLQNQPQRARSMFITEPGEVFGYFDLSQAEARYVAWDAKIDSWKQQFEQARIDGSYDAHRALASMMFNKPYDQVPEKDVDENGKYTIRYIAKRCRHGLNYRMGPERLAETTRLPLVDCIRYYHAYHRLTPELRRWWSRLEEEVRRNHCLYNSFGGRLLFLQRLDEAALESIVAYRPQSSIGVKVCRVIYQSQEDDKWPRHTRVALNVHDALITQGPESEVMSALAIMKRYAEEPILVQGEQMIIPADCAISQPDEKGIHRWTTLKKIKL